MASSIHGWCSSSRVPTFKPRIMGSLSRMISKHPMAGLLLYFSLCLTLGFAIYTVVQLNGISQSMGGTACSAVHHSLASSSSEAPSLKREASEPHGSLFSHHIPCPVHYGLSHLLSFPLFCDPILSTPVLTLYSQLTKVLKIVTNY